MRVVTLLAIVCWSVVARAEPGDEEAKGGFLLPALQLSASTDDTGKLKASIPYVLPLTIEPTVVASARFQVASAKGVSTLFSSNGSETLPWEAGLGLLVLDTQSADDLPSARHAKARAWQLCPASKDKDGKDVPAPANNKNLCSAALTQYLRYEATLVGTRSIPWNRLSLGGALGRQQFKYLNGIFGAGNTLTTNELKTTSGRIGVLYTNAAGLEGTHARIIEVRALYSTAYASASDIGHWCQPEGMVGNDPNSSVQKCKDLPLGAPKQSASYTLAADIGVADSFAQRWRASLGAFSTTGVTNVTDSFGFEAPIYVNFTPGSAYADYLGSYKGILRITPKVSWSKDTAGDYAATVVLTVEALAQDSIFSEILDY